MSTSRPLTTMSRFYPFILAFVIALPAMAQDTIQDAPFARAVELYQAAEYRQAVQLFEQIVAEEPSSEAYHWLGKSYGHMAEQAALFRALDYARKTRAALEKAVELDNRNRAAVKNLMEFYQQAPAMVGGSRERARRLQEQLAAMKHNEPGDPDYQRAAETGS